MRRYTYTEVRASYGGAKAAQERNDAMFRWFARPLSHPVAWVGLRLGLTPNHVTYVSLAGNVVGLVMLASGRRGMMMASIGVLLVALVLDAADGNMARTSRRFSPTGEWLEGYGAYLLYAGFHLAGGVGAWRAALGHTPVTHTFADPATAGALIGFGGLAAAAISVSIMMTSKFASVFQGVERESVVARAGKGLYGFLFTIGRNLSFPSGLVLPLTLVAISVRRYETVLVGFAALNVAMLAALTLRCAWLANGATASRKASGA